MPEAPSRTIGRACCALRGHQPIGTGNIRACGCGRRTYAWAVTSEGHWEDYGTALMNYDVWVPHRTWGWVPTAGKGGSDA